MPNKNDDNLNDDKTIEPEIARKYEDRETISARHTILRKTQDNMARAEAAMDETPLWTEKTAELERREKEDEDK